MARKGLEPQRSTMLGAAITARANVNVALIKYWGKRDPVLNLPSTGSISMTRDGLWVEATCAFGASDDECLIDGVPAADPDRARVLRFVDLVRTNAGIEARAAVQTRSGVPNGVGLASSAAAFASLAV